jgi:ribosomal protein S18 acetylase RimI-like enzyme
VDPADRQDLACLILADHPAADFLELIYFGVAPAGRGQRIGQSLLAEATQIARSLGRSRIVAAVDRQNLPALRVYLAADYQPIEEKSVFAYFFGVNDPVLDRPL